MLALSPLECQISTKFPAPVVRPRLIARLLGVNSTGMHIEPLDIPDVKLLAPIKHGDHRGFFSEVYNKRTLQTGRDFGGLCPGQLLVFG